MKMQTTEKQQLILIRMTEIVKTGNTKCCRGYGAPGTFTHCLLLLFSLLVTSSSFVTPWTVAHQAPMSMGFSRQEYWSGLPFPAPGDLFNSGIKCTRTALQVDSFPLSHQGRPYIVYGNVNQFKQFVRQLSSNH